MEFKVGDRVITKHYEHQRSNGYSTNGEIIASSYWTDGTFQVIWDIPEGHVYYNHLELYGEDKRHTTWVYPNDIELDIQYIRDSKLNQIISDK